MTGEIPQELAEEGVYCPGSGAIFYDADATSPGRAICPRCAYSIGLRAGLIDDHIVFPEYIRPDSLADQLEAVRPGKHDCHAAFLGATTEAQANCSCGWSGEIHTTGAGSTVLEVWDLAARDRDRHLDEVTD